MKKIIWIGILLLGYINGSAQNVSLDPTFGNNGIVTSTNTSTIIKSFILNDNKIISAGYAIAFDSTSKGRVALVKYKSNGVIDSTFGVNGFVRTAIGFSDNPLCSIIQPNGKVIVAGQVFSGPVANWPGQYRSFIIRYNLNGTPDSTFGTNGIQILDHLNNGSNSNFIALSLLPNGQILAAGEMAQYSTITKLNPDGSIDQLFGNNGVVILNNLGFQFTIYDFTILNDGKMLACGADASDIDNPKTAIIKLNPDGTSDNNFGTGGKIQYDKIVTSGGSDYEYATKIKVLSSGKILVSALANTDYLMQLLSDGQIDQSFGVNGIVDHNFRISDLEVTSDGRILVAGTRDSDNNDKYAISRYLYNGTLDHSFNTLGFFDFETSSGYEYLSSISSYGDSDVLVSGTSKQNGISNFTLARLIIGAPVTIIENDFIPHEVTVYPNPFSNEINFRSETEMITSVTISDVSGRKVTEVTSPGKSVAIDVPAGIYVCTLVTAKGNIYTRKLVKQ